MVYANNIHTKQLLCYRTSSFSGLRWRTSYNWRATAMKLYPKTFTVCSVVNFWGFCSNISGVARIVRPHPDNWTRSTVSKQKFNYSFLYLFGIEDQFSATEDTVRRYEPGREDQELDPRLGNFFLSIWKNKWTLTNWLRSLYFRIDQLQGLDYIYCGSTLEKKNCFASSTPL